MNSRYFLKYTPNWIRCVVLVTYCTVSRTGSLILAHDYVFLCWQQLVTKQPVSLSVPDVTNINSHFEATVGISNGASLLHCILVIKLDIQRIFYGNCNIHRATETEIKYYSSGAFINRLPA